MKKYIVVLIVLAVVQVQAQTKRPLTPKDVYRLQDINAPQVSPDGQWIAYELSTVDSAKDKRNTHLWMISWDGTQQLQLTNSAGSESSPKFSPDGRFISFLSDRKTSDDDKNDQNQLWLLDRRGGEGKKITSVKGDISNYIWSPDGKKVVLVMQDEDFTDTASSEVRTPYVIDRYHFKQDYVGYLDRRATHLYLLDINTQTIDTLTTGKYDEVDPDFSSDGKRIVFASNRTAEPDKNENTDIYIMDAKPGAAMQQLTTWPGTDHAPIFSPDGTTIAYLQGTSSEAFNMYGLDMVATVPVAGGTPLLLSKNTDRNIHNICWSKDGKAIVGLMDDDRSVNIVSFKTGSGAMEKLFTGEHAFYDIQLNPASGAFATLYTNITTPIEIYALENGNNRQITHVQDAFTSPLQIATASGFKSKSKDGTIVSGILYKPANAVAGAKLPLVLYIHGGPVAQDNFEFDIIAQTMASAGYAVAQVNYRGSDGRGLDYIRAIYSDWGNKEVMDILGAADYLVAQGIADANRIGMCGWSYGGILTDYTIASDTRIKAACSGAGSALQLSMYGYDQYITQYETELGVPWKNMDKWIKLSYPFFKADKIKTPTLFMAAEKDFNVPTIGAEQMYQALQTNGVPTQLVIYPGQHHGISTPSYQVDKYTRYVNWFNTYLK